MKRFLCSAALGLFSVYSLQASVLSGGTPALLEAANGKKIRVFLQGMEEESLTFQLAGSTKTLSVPASKIASLQFFPKYDAEGVHESFVNGDYEKVLSVLEPLTKEFAQYILIPNNMRDAFRILFDSFLSKEDYPAVREYAEYLLLAADDSDLRQRAKVGLVIAALKEADFSTVEALRSEIESPAAKLYLKAAVERAHNRPKKAIQTVTEIASNHANDMEWLPRSELLAAYCYLDMTGPHSVISTNSALNTARQVKNIYAGTHVAADAKKLWENLGGK